LIVVWRVAEFEARHLKASVIEPTHLLLGLCKSVDLDLPALIPKDLPDRDEVLEELLREVRRLRNVFRAAGLDARAFRRRLRRMSGGNRLAPSEAERLRRSKAARHVFDDAEHLAAMSDRMVFPVHLFYALTLARDDKRDELMVELGVDPKRLQQVAKREVLFQQNGGVVQTDKPRTHFN
jgi:ATP-dependent Clp protease ATP-binding subunit ClpA